jgi:tetratricopeptide (TPR) repeat protein
LIDNGQHDEVLSYYYVNAFGENNPSTARTHNNIAEVLEVLGEYTEALPHAEKAYNVRKRLLPPKHEHLEITRQLVTFLLISKGGITESFD